MKFVDFDFYKNKVIIRIKNRVCENSEELITSKLFLHVLKKCLEDLQKRKSALLAIFKTNKITDAKIQTLVQTLLYLTKMNGEKSLRGNGFRWEEGGAASPRFAG